MAANLTPQYLKAEEQYRRATTTEDELKALEIMLREMPKHKASEKLQSDLKQKISRAKKEIETGLLKIWAGRGKLFILVLFRGQAAESLLTQALKRVAQMLSSPLPDVFTAHRFQGLLEVLVRRLHDGGGQPQHHASESAFALLTF